MEASSAQQHRNLEHNSKVSRSTMRPNQAFNKIKVCRQNSKNITGQHGFRLQSAQSLAQHHGVPCWDTSLSLLCLHPCCHWSPALGGETLPLLQKGTASVIGLALRPRERKTTQCATQSNTSEGEHTRENNKHLYYTSWDRRRTHLPFRALIFLR